MLRSVGEDATLELSTAWIWHRGVNLLRAALANFRDANVFNVESAFAPGFHDQRDYCRQETTGTITAKIISRPREGTPLYARYPRLCGPKWYGFLAVSRSLKAGFH